MGSESNDWVLLASSLAKASAKGRISSPKRKYTAYGLHSAPQGAGFRPTSPPWKSHLRQFAQNPGEYRGFWGWGRVWRRARASRILPWRRVTQRRA